MLRADCNFAAGNIRGSRLGWEAWCLRIESWRWEAAKRSDAGLASVREREWREAPSVASDSHHPHWRACSTRESDCESEVLPGNSSSSASAITQVAWHGCYGAQRRACRAMKLIYRR